MPHGRQPGAPEAPVDFDRRNILRLGGAALGASLLATPGSAGTTRHGIDFSNVVEATDFGADPTGSSPSDAAVEDAVSEGTLVVFPPGEYRFTDTMVWTGLSTFGFYGDGDVTFRPPDGFNIHLLYVNADRFLFEGIDLDVRANDTVTGLAFKLRERLVVSDVTQLGRGTHSDHDVQNAFGCKITNSDGVGILRNVVIEQGSALGDYNGGDGRVAVFTGSKHEGTLKIQNCRFEEFGNNAIYCSKTPGDVHVENCVLRNNNIASVRLGGAGSYVKDTVVEMDMSKYTGPTDGLDQKFLMRGIWLEHLNREYGAGASIDGCTVSAANTDAASTGIVINSEVGAVDVTNTTVRVDTDGTDGIIRKYPDDGQSPLTLDNVSVVGSGANDDGVLVLGTSGSRIRNSCVYLPGSGRNGIRVKNATDCAIRDTNVSAGGERVVAQDCSVDRSNLSNDDSCPLPGDSSGSADHRIRIESVGSGDWAEYAFETSGAIQKAGTADSGDDVGVTTAEGGVGGGGTDAYTYDGELVEFDVLNGSPDDVAVFVDGTELDVGPEHTIELRSVGPENWVKYTFEASGSVVPLKTADSNDDVSGTTVEGGLANGRRDAFGFQGDLLDFSVVGGDPNSVAVYVDGSKLDRDADNTIEIHSVGSGDWTKYAFEATGDVDAGSRANSSDEVSGSGAVGGVSGGGVDSYRFAGDLQQFEVLGGDHDDVEVYVNGSRYDFVNTITIEGTGDFAAYEFEVSGSLKKGSTADSTDEISGSVATGGISKPGTDDFEFTGSLERFALTNGSGGADVFVNGDPYSF